MMSLSCLFYKNSNFPNFNWTNFKFGLGVDFRVLISKFKFILGSGHIDNISFDCSLFSPDINILFEN